MRLGQLIHAYREAHRLTIKALAAEVGVSPSALGQLESGKHPRWETWLKVWGWVMCPVEVAPAKTRKKRVSNQSEGLKQALLEDLAQTPLVHNPVQRFPDVDLDLYSHPPAKD